MITFLIIFVVVCSFFAIVFFKYINKLNQLIFRAEILEDRDKQNPFEVEELVKSLDLYERAYYLICNSTLGGIADILGCIDKEKWSNKIRKLKAKIQNRNRFQQLFFQGKKQAQNKFFDLALNSFKEANTLFTTEELKNEIDYCNSEIQKQEKYEKIINDANDLAFEGKFQEAINLLQPALIEFSRADGQKLLTKLERIVRGRECFLAGIKFEREEQLYEAKNKYKQALELIPELVECRIRLAIIAVKFNDFTEILYVLDNVTGDTAAYIRGFAYAKQKNWQQANREWRSLSHDNVKAQCQIIKNLVRRDRLLIIRKIEEFIDNNNLQEARTTSLDFIQKFGADSLVENNLKEHIQPLLKCQLWQTKDWEKIAVQTEEIWLEQQDIISLHNWAIATYYQVQINSNKLADFIGAWLTALANIQINPSLKNVSWLGSTSIDFNEVSSNLKQILENAIDAVKDSNINEYLRLRDLYRGEIVTLRLMGNPPSCGMRVKQLFITPGCYQRYRHKLAGIIFPAKLWGALYTDWGLAVAACLEKDTARAIQIKPVKHPSSQADRFAYSFVSYHEGCYHLQNLEWRKAINPLQQAKADIKAESDWCKEIDRLCELQRQKLDNFDEHLQFSQFWYELLVSQPGRSYFAECKARKVAQKIGDEKISIQQGLKELKEIQNIDPNNPLALDLIEKVEIAQEEENIDRLMRQDRFEEAVRQAKRSRHESIRFMVAEICIDILLKGAENRSLSFELMHQLGHWAYELCPHEPAFMPLYSELGIYR